MSAAIQAQPARSAKEQFDKQASHYDAQWNSWNRESLEWMLDRSETISTDSALDIATGAGFTALAFAGLVRDVIGVDVSAGMLSQARSRAVEQGIDNAEFRLAPAEELPFADSSFDVVTCRIAAHHFLDIHAFAREAARVLLPGGRLLVADSTVPDDAPDAAEWQNAVEIARDPSHVRNYTPLKWQALVKKAGLTVAEATSSGGGITIPLTDWMRKSGCTAEQEKDVRSRFATAPESARKLFNIRQDEAGETFFTWQRVLLKAIKR
jgi:ubiquinone/menaquinone biosynthesis C-methylase UbiE